MKIKIIDRYISKNFIKSFFLSLIAFVGIFLVSQLFKVIRYVSDGRFSADESIVYILTMIPKILIDVAPLAVLLGSLMTVSSMASNLEVISLKTAGISFKRIVLFPIFISAVIAIIVFLINDSLYPYSVRKNREIKDGGNTRREMPVEKRNAFLRGENSNYVYLMGKINRETGFGENIEIVDLNEEFNKVERIITAKEGRYNFTKKVWVLKDANIYNGKELKKAEEVKLFTEDKYDDEPDKFITKSVEPKTLTIKELKKSVREIKV